MKRSPEALESWLRQHGPALLGDESPGGAHVGDDRLAQIAEGTAATRPERDHLARCSECRLVLSDLGHVLPAPKPVRARWFAWLPLGALAAAAMVALVLWPETKDDGTFGVRGDPAPLEATVALLATRPDGSRIDLRGGEKLSLGARLGFRYGNPGGTHRTLTVLGWDGKQVHWYYPEKPGAAPFTLEGGDSALSRRLPFDIALAEKHQAGRLWVVAAFDADPVALGKQLKAGQRPTGPHLRSFELWLEP